MLARHRKEVRDLTATVTGLKKSATKGEKKKKKEILQQVEIMERDQKERHKRELESLASRGAVDSADANGTADAANNDNDDEEEEELTPEMLLAQLALEEEERKKPAMQKEQTQPAANGGGGGGGKKRNRRKEKLAQREAERQRLADEAAAEASEQPDLRKIELETMQELCNRQNLVQHEIAPDGHCLFASIADQLAQRHGKTVSVAELRQAAASHIRADPNTFAPFLFDEATLTMREIEPYCDELENTAVWGGDMEILALAKVYDCPISVLFSGRSSLKVNEDGSQPELKLGYYKHSFGLGEHYNSLRDKPN